MTVDVDKSEFVQQLNTLSDDNKIFFSLLNYEQMLNSLHCSSFDMVQPYVIQSLKTHFEFIRIKLSDFYVEVFRNIIILECILYSWDSIFSNKYPLSIQKQYKKNFNRMLSLCRTPKGWSVYNENVYWKDLALARQQMFPAFARVVEVYSGMGFRQGFSLNPLQSLRFIKLLIKGNGRTGYYELHTHTPLLNDFNNQDWHNCIMLISDMLKKNLNVKGLFCSSWFYDPQLKHISPRLKYLRELFINNGALSFCVGDDSTGNAFAKSNNRLKLYREGKYNPKCYMLVWPRQSLIKWSKNYK